MEGVFGYLKLKKITVAHQGSVAPLLSNGMYGAPCRGAPLKQIMYGAPLRGAPLLYVCVARC